MVKVPRKDRLMQAKTRVEKVEETLGKRRVPVESVAVTIQGSSWRSIARVVEVCVCLIP